MRTDGVRSLWVGRGEIRGVGEDECSSFPFTLGLGQRASLAVISIIEAVITC